MHNLKEIRKDFSKFEKDLEKRSVKIDFINLKKLDELNRDLIQIKENLEWEKIRYLSHMIYNTNVTKKSHLIEPKKLFPLPQDKMYKKEVVIPTKQDLENFEKQISKITKKTILKI